MFARLAPSACSSPRPSEWRRSSSAASRGWLVTIARAAVLLPPAERRHVVVVAVQQPGLAGAGLRGPVGLPALQPVAVVVHPARERRRVAVAQRAPQHVVGEAVDLQEQHAGHVASAPPACVRLSWRRDDVAVHRSPRSSASTAADERRQRGQRERDDERRPSSPSTWTPSSICATRSSTSALSASAPSPSVMTVNGSATRISSGQIERVRERRARRRGERGAEAVGVKPGRIAPAAAARRRRAGRASRGGRAGGVSAAWS